MTTTTKEHVMTNATTAHRDSNTMTNAELLAEGDAIMAAFDRRYPGLAAKENRQMIAAERKMNR